MNTSRRKPIKFLSAICSMLTSIVILTACGGGGGGSDKNAGIGGTGIVVGKITGFGSVHVNGGIFDTNQSQFIVDGNPGVQDDLSVGMVVLLRVETNNGIFTGKALDIVYDDEVEGPITSVTPDPVDPTLTTITVFGQTITLDDTDTLFEDATLIPDPNFGFATIAVNDIVEISGFRASASAIDATYVKKTDDLVLGNSEVELRGPIQMLAGTLPNQTFKIDGVNITTDGTSQLDVPSGVLVEDLNVEVEGVIQSLSPTTVLASKVEFEDEDFGDDVDDVSLQGVISNYMGDDDFEIDGQSINALGVPFSPPGATLSEGLEVEVEGDIVGGVLMADELEVREGEAKLKATISPGSVNVGMNRFEVFYPNLPGTVVINVNAQTLFKDEAGLSPLPDFSIDDLSDNDFVKIEGQEVNDEVVASIVKRIDPDDFKLQGAVDIFDPVGNDWIEILGIRYDVNADTEFEDGAGGILTRTMFFGQLDVGDLVELEDDAFPFGVADEVEFE